MRVVAVEPACAEPGSAAGYIEGNGFGAENLTITVGGIEAEVLAATGHDASFVVPEGIPAGPIEVVVTNPNRTTLHRQEPENAGFPTQLDVTYGGGPSP
jgi:hypothetical protein